MECFFIVLATLQCSHFSGSLLTLRNLPHCEGFFQGILESQEMLKTIVELPESGLILIQSAISKM